MNRDEALKVVDLLYAAALGEAEWKATLASIADTLGCSAANVEIHDTMSGKLLHFDSARLDPDNIALYARDYAWRNPRTLRALTQGRDLINFDHLFLTEAEMDLDPFYAEFLAPSDLRYFVSAQTPLLDGRIKGVLALQRPGRIRGANLPLVESMRLLQPHIERALRLFWMRKRHIIDPEIFDFLLARQGLTPAERRLAIAIGCGETLTDFSKRTGVSMNTVYTHYRQLKDKLDCARQSDLVLLLRTICTPPAYMQVVGDVEDSQT